MLKLSDAEEITFNLRGTDFTRTDFYIAKDCLDSPGFQVLRDMYNDLERSELTEMIGAQDITNDHLRECRGAMRIAKAQKLLEHEIAAAIESIDIEAAGLREKDSDLE